MPKSKLTDEDLIIMARTLQAREKKIKDEATAIDKEKAAIIKELEKRKIEAVEIDGWRLNGVWGTDTVIDEPGLVAALTPKQKKAVMKEVLDRKLLSQAIQAKIIPLKTLKRHSGTKPRKPYYRLTKLKKTKKK
jgi:hypothetical protein